MAENHFTSTIESLFKGMDQFVTTKTVVGEPVQVGETIIIPLIDVTCGMAAGAFAEGSKQKDKGCGGMSAKMSPSAVLVIQNGVTKLVNVKNQDAVTKVIDMAPDLINRFLRKTGCIRRNSRHCKETAASYEGKKPDIKIKQLPYRIK